MRLRHLIWLGGLLPALLEARSPEAAAWLERGLAAERAGQRAQAMAFLERAAASDQPAVVLEAKTHLGAICTCERPAALAERYSREALMLAEQLRADAAPIWLNLGNNLAAQGRIGEALEAFAEAARSPSWAARARANGAAAAAARADGRAEEWNAAALAELERLPATVETAWVWLRCAETDVRLGQLARAAASWERARLIAEQTGNRRVLCWALGGLAGLPGAEAKGALGRAREAAFLAQEQQMPEALYRWEWTVGRLLRAGGDRAGALAAYRRAVAAVEPIRLELMAGCGAARPSFREAVAPLYYEYADLLLADDAALPAARAVLEQLQGAELDDFLQDECASASGPVTRQPPMPPGAVALYLIPLPERTELLLVFSSGLERVRVPVGAAELAETVRQFRRQLERRATAQYLVPARQLYDWLMAPIVERLRQHQVRTIIVEPQGVLRAVPLAALYDGQRFLVEEFAVAVQPGTHWRAQPMARQGLKTLAGGLAVAMEGFAELPGVPRELAAVAAEFPGPVLLNETFTVAVLGERLRGEQYQVVHLATHALVEADFGRSFLLTRDGRVTLTELETLLRPGQYRGRPLELLTLSACQTAAGDERALLGLAGVAMKAGARSAVATLWFVQDESAALIMSEFYRALKKKSKAEALQTAQIRALRDPRFEHPGYWAAYVVIGNWL